MNTPLHRLKLRPLGTPDRREEIDVPADGLSLGRDATNLLAFEDCDSVSLFHARLEWHGGSLVIEDLDSKNGTFVNGGKVVRRALHHGDLVALGRQDGPRFLVITSGLEATGGAAPKAPGMSTFSPSRVLRLRRALGIPERRPWRRLAIRSAAVALLSATAIAGLFYFEHRTQGERAESRRLLEDRLQAARRGFLEEQQSAWLDARERLARERKELREEMSRLEKSGRDHAGAIQVLRESLASTTAKLEQYNPINLEKVERERRDKLMGVLQAVVFVEKKVLLRERDGERYVDVTDSGELRLVRPRDPDEAHPFSVENGSGFCASPRGWIITNAHVVQVPAAEAPLYVRGVSVVLEPLIHVVFSESAERYRAKVVKVIAEDASDFAVLEITPFAGMPSVDDFRIDTEPPPAGAPVTLFGFPLGKRLPHDRDIVSASVFSGIVSRRIGAFLQVQAAVYPGNSGGPVLDESARVIGVVTAVQRVPGGQIASDIGYVLPIGGLGRIWPPE